MIQLQDNNNVWFCNTTNLDNELQKNLEENESNDENVTNKQVHHNDVQLEENENNNDMLNYIPSNIYDSGNLKNIDTKLRDLLVERGPIRDNDIIFPKVMTLDIFLPFSTLEYYQMGRSMIENG